MILEIVHAAQKLNFTQCILIVPALLAVVAMMLPLLRKSMGITVSSELTDSAAEAFGAIALFFVFITASSLSTVQGFQKDGLKVTETEVAKIVNLDRELVTIPGEKAVLARVALKDYLTSIIDKEWKELEHGHSSEETDRALGGLISAVHHLKDDGVNEKILSSVEAHTEAVSDLRDERIGVSEEHLSVIYWGIIFAFLLMLFVISFFSNPALPKRVGLAGKMIALGFSLVLLIQTDGVFSGDVAVQPTVYKNALAKMKIRTADSS